MGKTGDKARNVIRRIDSLDGTTKRGPLGLWIGIAKVQASRVLILEDALVDEVLGCHSDKGVETCHGCDDSLICGLYQALKNADEVA